MKITAIKQQVKRADRYSVYLDGKYTFSLGESQLLDIGLKLGQEITSEELDKLHADSVYGKLYDRILNLLSIRPRSEWELRDYLKRKKAEPEIIDSLLNALSKLGYVDDEKFATRWLENRRLLKSVSKRKLQQELRQKRIEDTIITKVLQEDETDERETLRSIVEKKRSRYPDQLKLMQYLARQGFNYDDIKSALQETRADD